MKTFPRSSRYRTVERALMLSLGFSGALSGCAHAPKRTGRSPGSDDSAVPKSTPYHFTTPTEDRCYYVAYRDIWKMLKPGEAADFWIPEHLRNKPVTFVDIGHSQLQPYGDWDAQPGITSVQFHVKKDGSWRYWGGPSSGPGGGKFAEYRGGGQSLEMDALYEWGTFGNYTVEGNHPSRDPLFVDQMRAVSVGTDEVQLGSLAVNFWPASIRKLETHTFSPGTAFGDYVSTAGASYNIDYATAWKLPGGDGKADASGARLNNGQIEIPLAVGAKLRSVEVACGDAKENSSALGGGDLSIAIRHADGTREMWKSNENVPPAGILKAGALDCAFQAKAGDVVEVSAGGDDVWVMGVRLGID